MIRCYVPSEAWTQDAFLLPASEVRHVLLARRARSGELVEILDGAGRRAEARLLVRADRTVEAQILETRLELRPFTDVGLVVGLPKGDKSDWIVQKGVELGLSRIWLAVTEHTVARPEVRQRRERVERWRRIAVEAIKQCGHAWLPDVRLFDSLDQLLATRAPDDRWLVGALAPDARPLRAVLEEMARESPAPHVTALIGPEGDFSAEELRRLCTAGAIPVSFGTAILRVETAALFVAAALKLFFSQAT